MSEPRVSADPVQAPQVLRELRDGVLLLTLNRPERRNATTPEMVRLYMRLVLDAARDDAVKVIVVTGAGPAFCAGADTGNLDKFAQGQPRAEKLRRHWFTRTIPKPIIAAINGPCVGVGFVIAMMCDMRIAGRGARVGPGFARLGLPAENAVHWMLQRTVGYARAYEILVTGRLYSGDALQRLGVVNEIVDDDQVLPHTLALASDMAAHCSPRAMAIMKRQLQLGFQHDLPEADRLADRLVTECLAGHDFKEAMAGRRENRAPRFASLGEAWWLSDEAP